MRALSVFLFLALIPFAGPVDAAESGPFCDDRGASLMAQREPPIVHGGTCEVDLHIPGQLEMGGIEQPVRVRNLALSDKLLEELEIDVFRPRFYLGISDARLSFGKSLKYQEATLVELSLVPRDGANESRLLAIALATDGLEVFLKAYWVAPPRSDWSFSSGEVLPMVNWLGTDKLTLGKASDFGADNYYWIPTQLSFDEKNITVSVDNVGSIQFPLENRKLRWASRHLRNGMLLSTSHTPGFGALLDWPQFEGL